MASVYESFSIQNVSTKGPLTLRTVYKTLFPYVCLRSVTRNDSKIGPRVCVAGRAILCDHSIDASSPCVCNL